MKLIILLLDILRQYIKMQERRPGYYLFNNVEGADHYNERSAQANASQMSISLKGYVQYMQEQLDYANNLITFLNKEYHAGKSE